MASELLRSPLHDRHVAAGARFGEFGGWEMPLAYPGDGGGTVAEHQAVRTAVGIFDVSHLGKLSVTGPGARQFLNAVLTNDLFRIEPGFAQYTLCCTRSGGVIDDLIAYVNSDDDVFLVPNAANTSGLAQRLAGAAPAGVEVKDQHRDYAVIAVQGPQSPQLLADLGLPSGHPYMSHVLSDWKGEPLIVCRSGYTGERGYELIPRWDAAEGIWDALVAAGGVPCGLGARDTLRTEMGYPLHGQDLSADISPVAARLGWAVGWKKGAFWGRDALLAERAAPSRLLWGLRVSTGIARPGMAVSGASADGAGDKISGTVTSGTFSPTLGAGIALAILSGAAEGDEASVDVRGRAVAATVVKPPFVSASPR
ncbi:MAG TPA: glycine cleavage system aminomethyltransferase GcvT [Frankiaceae bacterium]|jgi:aminomethyltransferase|nr:glycine cleavage system aminomethyltransferase GcvT [Frankiaceae bacterium]